MQCVNQERNPQNAIAKNASFPKKMFNAKNASATFLNKKNLRIISNY